MQTDSSPQEFFRMILLTVVGQAFTAAGYILQDSPTTQAGGLFRFVKPFVDGWFGIIEFQLLAYTDTDFAPSQPSRFRVTLLRGESTTGATSSHPNFARRDLSALVVTDFGVPILPSASHWWAYRNVTELGAALGEAGHLIVGYGVPWLAGELQA
jgi:hypothetical protein